MKRITALVIFLAIAVPYLYAQSGSDNRIVSSVEQFYADVQSLNQVFVLEKSPKYFDRMEQLYNGVAFNRLSFNVL